MKHFFREQRLAAMSVLLGMLLAGAVSVYAGTTIGTDISTDGSLTVTGQAAIGNIAIPGSADFGGGQVPSSIALVVNNKLTDISGSGGAAGTWAGLNQVLLLQDPTDQPTSFLTGVGGAITINDGSGDTGTIEGVGGYVENDNADATKTVAAMYGGAFAYGNFGASTVTAAAAIHAFVYSAGPIVNGYGLLIDDITGATNSYAIKTGLGKVSFGDNVGIGTTTPSTRLVVTAGANATTTVTIGELGLSTSKGCVNINTSAGTPMSFYFNAARVMVIEANYCR